MVRVVVRKPIGLRGLSVNALSPAGKQAFRHLNVIHAHSRITPCYHYPNLPATTKKRSKTFSLNERQLISTIKRLLFASACRFLISILSNDYCSHPLTVFFCFLTPAWLQRMQQSILRVEAGD